VIRKNIQIEEALAHEGCLKRISIYKRYTTATHYHYRYSYYYYYYHHHHHHFFFFFFFLL
jgi:hypothetical protein